MGDIGKPIRETERPAPVPAPAPPREPAPVEPERVPAAPPGEHEIEPVEGATA